MIIFMGMEWRVFRSSICRPFSVVRTRTESEGGHSGSVLCEIHLSFWVERACVVMNLENRTESILLCLSESF